MTLPIHGKINCYKCYRSCGSDVYEPHPLWRMRNDPGAWGSSEPEVLVLGFSKGSTQANIYQNGKFESVAFGGRIRDRLDEVLKRIGLLSEKEHVTEHIENLNSRFAFGSLVRCSLTREGKDGKHASSGQLVVKSFKEIPNILDNCAQKFIANLPERTKTILMLGVSDAYIEGCYKLLARIYPRMQKINNVAYRDGNRLFVHVTHPSPGNGHFFSWVRGNPKFEGALDALNQKMKEAPIDIPEAEKTELDQTITSIDKSMHSSVPVEGAYVKAETITVSTAYRTRHDRVPVSTIGTFCVPFNPLQNGKEGYKIGDNPVKHNGIFVLSYEEALEKLRKMKCAGWRAYGKGPGNNNGGARKAIAWVTLEDARRLLEENDDNRRVQLFKSLSDLTM